MDQLQIAKEAIETEIKHLSDEIERLEAVLGHLAGTKAAAPASTSGSAASPTRGGPKGAMNGKSAKASKSPTGTGMDAVLKVIADAGKGGIKALSLASALKKSGLDRPSKTELVETDKIKVSGNGGGTTYTFVR